MPKKRSKRSNAPTRSRVKKQKVYSEKELAKRAEVEVQRTAKANAPLECPAIPPMAHAPPAAAAGNRTQGDNVNYDERDKALPKKLFSEAAKRTMIGGYFVYQHGMETDETLWGGKGGIIADIKRVFDVPRGTEVADILRAVIMCDESDEFYDGSTITKKNGRIPIMSIHSQEGTIAANNVERGVSKPMICMMVNDHRMQVQKPSVTQSAIDGLLSRMRPKKKSIDKRPQGSYDIFFQDMQS